MKNRMISSRILRVAITIFSILLIGSCDSDNIEKVKPGKNVENSSEINIPNNILSKLQKYKYINIDFNANIENSNDIVSFSSLNIYNSPPAGIVKSYPLVWNGTSFSSKFDYTWNLFSGEKVHNTGTISGTVSATGLNINSLTAHESSDYLTENMTYFYDITVKDVPYQSDYEYNEYSPRFSIHGTSVSQNISSFSMQWDYIDYEGVTQSRRSTKVDYDDPNDEPYLHITFSERN